MENISSEKEMMQTYRHVPVTRVTNWSITKLRFIHHIKSVHAKNTFC